MTREERIKINTDAFVSVESSDMWDDGSLAFGFEKGARWADSHPINPWRSVNDELPKADGRYLTSRSNGFICITHYSSIDNHWVTVGYQSDIKFWMSIPELPKGKEEQK